MKNALVILAGGKGTRFRQKTPKQFYKVGNRSILNIFLSKIQIDDFDFIVISVDQKYKNILKK